MKPVSKVPPVAVWVMTSAFRQITLCPTRTSAGLGEYDDAPRLPAIVMTRSGKGVGPGVGVGDAPGSGVAAGPRGDPCTAVTDRSQEATRPPLVTSNVARNDPRDAYVCRGWGFVDVPPSPKRQSKS